MKKTIKGLIIAASVAAVVGVGAISYAAWTNGGTNNATGTGQTGVINTLGNITVEPSDATGTLTSLKKLYPVDQGTGTSAAIPTTGENAGVAYWEFKLSTDVTGEQAVAYKLAGTITKGEGEAATPVTGATLYWTTTDPTTKTLTADDGTALAAAITDAGAALGTDVENGDTIYVYMISSDTEAMNADIALTFAQESSQH